MPAPAQTLDCEPWLVAWLVARLAGRTPAVGDRVYPWSAPQAGAAGGEMPYVLFTTVAADRVRGIGGGATGLSWAVVQVDCYAASTDDAKAVAHAIQGDRADRGLDGFRGVWARPGHGPLNVTSAKPAGPGSSDAVAPRDGSAAGAHRATRDYEIWFEESLSPEA